MKNLLQHIVESIVDKPNEVVIVEETDGQQGTKFSITVGEGDAGRVVGRGGQVITAIRLIMRMAAGRQRQHCTIEINGGNKNVKSISNA